MHHSPLLEQYLPQLQKLTADSQAPVLDLACGRGRNGLYLIDNNTPVTFADVNAQALEQVKQSLNHAEINKHRLTDYWQVDFEQVATTSLQGKSFAGILVFRYLHRPLFEQIKAAIKPGGMIIYETFTEQQAQFGRPKNPNFLLKAGELTQLFSGWQILHSFEGIVDTSPQIANKQAIAQLVAIKPN